MALPRREFLIAGALAPVFSSCATDPATGRAIPIGERISELGVCAAARLVAAVLADGPLLSLIRSNPVPCDPTLGLAWGYGWGIETAAGGPYLWHWGNNPGFRAFAMASVASGSGFVLFANSERSMPLAASLAHTTVPAEHGVFHFHMLG